MERIGDMPCRMETLTVYLRVLKTSLWAYLMRKRNIRKGYDGAKGHFRLASVSSIHLRSCECHAPPAAGPGDLRVVHVSALE